MIECGKADFSEYLNILQSRASSREINKNIFEAAAQYSVSSRVIKESSTIRACLDFMTQIQKICLERPTLSPERAVNGFEQNKIIFCSCSGVLKMIDSLQKIRSNFLESLEEVLDVKAFKGIYKMNEEQNTVVVAHWNLIGTKSMYEARVWLDPLIEILRNQSTATG